MKRVVEYYTCNLCNKESIGPDGWTIYNGVLNLAGKGFRVAGPTTLDIHICPECCSVEFPTLSPTIEKKIVGWAVSRLNLKL